MRVLISRRAEDDLAHIYAWIACEHDIESAERFQNRAEDALAQLAEHPELGPHPGWATRHSRLRFWVVTRSNYLIHYEIRDDQIHVERMLDGRRDVRRIVESGIEEPDDDSD